MDCPHCNKPGISAWSKFMAGTALPANCKFCGKPSSLAGWILVASGLIFEVGLIVAVIAALYQSSFWPLIAAIVLYALFQICLIGRVPLKPLSDERVSNSRKFLFAFIGIFVLAILLAGLI